MYAFKTPAELTPPSPLPRLAAPPGRAGEMAALFCANQTVITDASEALELFHRQGPISNFSLHRNRFATDVELALPRLDEAYLLQLTLKGVTRATLGGCVVKACAGDFTVLNPGSRAHWRWERGTEVVTVRIRRTEFERVAAAELGEHSRPQTLFDFQLTSMHAAPTLVGFLQLLCDDHDCSRALSHPLGSKLCAEMLVSLMLRLLPNDGRRHLNGSVSPAAPYYVRRAVRHMEKHFADPISLRDLATSAGVCSRTLDKGFRRFIDASPMEHLRSIRLRNARSRLGAPSGDASTVTSIANLCGFRHLGRFAEYYSRAFGELPSDTLLKAQRD